LADLRCTRRASFVGPKGAPVFAPMTFPAAADAEACFATRRSDRIRRVWRAHDTGAVLLRDADHTWRYGAPLVPPMGATSEAIRAAIRPASRESRRLRGRHGIAPEGAIHAAEVPSSSAIWTTTVGSALRLGFETTCHRLEVVCSGSAAATNS
jgi:hypothetical protein